MFCLESIVVVSRTKRETLWKQESLHDVFVCLPYFRRTVESKLQHKYITNDWVPAQVASSPIYGNYTFIIACCMRYYLIFRILYYMTLFLSFIDPIVVVVANAMQTGSKKINRSTFDWFIHSSADFWLWQHVHHLTQQDIDMLIWCRGLYMSNKMRTHRER